VFIYSTDNYIENVASAQSKTYDQIFGDIIKEATENMNNFLTYAIEDNLHVVWDQTNMSSKKRKGILSKFPKSYRKVCWCVAPPRTPEEWVELERRLSSREGKAIPHHIIQSMANSYVEPELDEGFDYIFIVDLFGNTLTEKGTKL
jgi:tRNA uridine 5-carbamoylmethylation protein Kti12